MVVSRRSPQKSVCTSPTRLKNLLGDTEVSGTVRYCLVIRDKSRNSRTFASSLLPIVEDLKNVKHIRITVLFLELTERRVNRSLPTTILNNRISMSYNIVALHDLTKTQKSKRCRFHSEICKPEIRIFLEQFLYKDRRFIFLNASFFHIRFLLLLSKRAVFFFILLLLCPPM